MAYFSNLITPPLFVSTPFQLELTSTGHTVKVKAKVEVAKKIPNLPGYMEHRFLRLIDQLNRMDYIKGAIEAVRKPRPYWRRH